MPRMMGTGRRRREASIRLSNWVLSPSSPTATEAVETRKASTSNFVPGGSAAGAVRMRTAHMSTGGGRPSLLGVACQLLEDAAAVGFRAHAQFAQLAQLDLQGAQIGNPVVHVLDMLIQNRADLGAIVGRLVT